MSHDASPRDQAERHFQQKRYAEAHGVCMTVLRNEPAAAWPYALMGRIARDHRTFDKAAQLFHRASILEPGDSAHLVELAFCLNGLNRSPDAVAAARRALAAGVADASSLDRLGVILSRGNRQDLAAECFPRAAALEPANAGFLLNLGWAEQFLGDFEAAGRAWRACVAQDPDNDRGWSALVRLQTQTAEANAIPELERLFNAVGDDPERRLQIGHALAKSWEDLGDPRAALDWLIKAKSARRRRVSGLDDWRRGVFSAAATVGLARGPGEGYAAPDPIFVFGLPRSGTTLVERMLTSHPAIASAGEPMDFALLTRRLAGAPTKGLIDGETLTAASARADMTRLGQAYVSAIRANTSGGVHFIDKTPLNFLYAGLINRALPNARMICLRRDPVDSCLSVFRQIFAGAFAYYDWVYDLADTARFYVDFDALIANWRRTLPADRFTEVAYEDVVADPEGQMRRLLGWLDLDWDDAVLDFQHNAAPVATASAVQVREPVHGRSVGRWRRYGAGLKPMTDILAEAGLIEGPDDAA